MKTSKIELMIAIPKISAAQSQSVLLI